MVANFQRLFFFFNINELLHDYSHSIFHILHRGFACIERLSNCLQRRVSIALLLAYIAAFGHLTTVSNKLPAYLHLPMGHAIADSAKPTVRNHQIQEYHLDSAAWTLFAER